MCVVYVACAYMYVYGMCRVWCMVCVVFVLCVCGVCLSVVCVCVVCMHLWCMVCTVCVLCVCGLYGMCAVCVACVCLWCVGCVYVWCGVWHVFVWGVRVVCMRVGCGVVHGACVLVEASGGIGFLTTVQETVPGSRPGGTAAVRAEVGAARLLGKPRPHRQWTARVTSSRALTL